jgi:hypothetical protein
MEDNYKRKLKEINMTEIQLLRQDMDISKAMMMITIIVAISSIVFSSITMAFERSHDRKSLRPYLNLIPGISTNSISLEIANAGLGPMLIQKLTLLDQQTREVMELSALPGLFQPDAKLEGQYRCFNGYILASLKQLTLFQLYEDCSPRNSNISSIKESLERFSLQIEYQDVYERNYKKEVEIHF